MIIIMMTTTTTTFRPVYQLRMVAAFLASAARATSCVTESFLIVFFAFVLEGLVDVFGAISETLLPKQPVVYC